MSATLELRLTGGASNTDPTASLGGIMSSEAISSTALNNLFDDIDTTEASSGDTEYRMLDIYNSGDATATSVQLYVSSETTSESTALFFGEDGINNPHAADTELELLNNESTAPADPVITFGTYTSSSKLSLDDIPVGEAIRVCVKRVVDAGAENTSSDTATIAVSFA